MIQDVLDNEDAEMDTVVTDKEDAATTLPLDMTRAWPYHMQNPFCTGIG